jgi:hypothetical protein
MANTGAYDDPVAAVIAWTCRVCQSAMKTFLAMDGGSFG